MDIDKEINDLFDSENDETIRRFEQKVKDKASLREFNYAIRKLRSNTLRSQKLSALLDSLIEFKSKNLKYVQDPLILIQSRGMYADLD